MCANNTLNVREMKYSVQIQQQLRITNNKTIQLSAKSRILSTGLQG